MDKSKMFFSCEVRAKQDDSEKTYIEGRPIVFNSTTDLGFCNEIIEKQALDKADLSDVKLLVNHDTSKLPLARYKKDSKDNTMQIAIDEKGLTFRADLDIERNQDAKALYSAVSRGDITGMSFMFTIDNEEWEDLETDHPTRKVLKIGKVFEISAVTFPAYESTEISARSKKDFEAIKALKIKNKILGGV